jgi:hypothetical protein
MPPGTPDVQKKHVTECPFVSDHFHGPSYDAVTSPAFWYRQGVHPYCVEFALANVFSYMGLRLQETLFTNAIGKIHSLQVAMDLLRKHGGTLVDS